jgi:UMF1 family MFS transporter
MAIPAAPPADGTYSRHEQAGWYCYDWANSVYSTTVVTLFLGPYLTSIAKVAAAPDGFIYPFGVKIEPRAYWGYLVSLSVLTQVIAMPLIGAIADHGRKKREFLAGLAYTGALATMAMYFVEGANYMLGGLLFLISNLAFGASMVVYNAFLPEIAPPEERDNVSSKGWGIGYLGGGLMLALSLVFLTNAGRFGLAESHAVRVSLLGAGVWWALFTLVPVARLRNRGPVRKLAAGEHFIPAGLKQLRQTFGSILHYPQTVLFLGAYLLYNDAIQTVIALSGQFGADELKMPMSKLALAILMVQFVAFFGATGFNRIAAGLGAKRTVIVTLIIWTGTLVYIYFGVRSHAEFFVMAALVALVMGGSQALSRSLFSLMIPAGKEAEYFSIYEITDKGTSWLGPLVFALALQWTGNYRTAILSLIVFFAGGMLLLMRVDVARAAREAGNAAPARV